MKRKYLKKLWNANVFSAKPVVRAKRIASLAYFRNKDVDKLLEDEKNKFIIEKAHLFYGRMKRKKKNTLYLDF